MNASRKRYITGTALASAAFAAGSIAHAAALPCPEDEFTVTATATQDTPAYIMLGMNETQPEEQTVTLFEVPERGELSLMCDGATLRFMFNGKPIPAEQVTQSGGRTLFMDPRGGELAELQINAVADGAYLKLESLAQPKPRAVLGVTLAPVDNPLASHIGVEPGQGVLIATVRNDSAASAAGLRPNDVIVQINETAPVSEEKLRGVLRACAPQDLVTLRGIRSGKFFETEARLKAEQIGLPKRYYGSDLTVTSPEISFFDTIVQTQPDRRLPGTVRVPARPSAPRPARLPREYTVNVAPNVAGGTMVQIDGSRALLLPNPPAAPSVASPPARPNPIRLSVPAPLAAPQPLRLPTMINPQRLPEALSPAPANADCCERLLERVEALEKRIERLINLLER